MYFTNSALAALLGATALALPTTKGTVSEFSILDSILLLDAPAYYQGSDLKATFRAHTFSRLSIKPPDSVLLLAFTALGIVVDEDLTLLVERTKFFFVDAQEGKTVDLKTPKGCLDVSVGKTEAGGFVEQQVSLGKCGGDQPKIVEADLSLLDTRDFKATVFPSKPDGFGIISGMCSHAL